MFETSLALYYTKNQKMWRPQYMQLWHLSTYKSRDLGGRNNSCVAASAASSAPPAACSLAPSSLDLRRWEAFSCGPELKCYFNRNSCLQQTMLLKLTEPTANSLAQSNKRSMAARNQQQKNTHVSSCYTEVVTCAPNKLARHRAL